MATRSLFHLLTGFILIWSCFQRQAVILKTIEAAGLKYCRAVERAITARTKAIIMNSPSNPTRGLYNDGAGCPREILAGREILVISDDIYEKIYTTAGSLRIWRRLTRR